MASAPNDDRVIVDNSNLSELKATCDDAVERVGVASLPLLLI